MKNLLRTGECSRFVLTVPEKQQEQGGRNMRVLGIDPGLRNMGWGGVIDTDGVRMSTWPMGGWCIRWAPNCRSGFSLYMNN